ncbi:MAG TPA: metallophosphoesterase family protein [Anaerolineales bacterium]
MILEDSPAIKHKGHKAIYSNKENHMRIAIIADLHGILPALDAMLDEIKNEDIEGIIVAGDMIAGPNSAEVVKKLRQCNCWMIRGNQENYIIQLASGKAPDWQYSCKQWNYIRWTYEHTDNDTLNFLQSIPEQCTIQFTEKEPIRVVHGSPSNVSELIFPYQDISKLDKALEQVTEPVIIFGHSHEAWTMKRNGKLAVNPGSLSMSFFGKQHGTYAILDWENQHWNVEIRKLFYNSKLVRKAYIETGLLEKGGAFARCCLISIETGIDYLPPMLDYAYKKAEEAGYGDSPFVPDEIWYEATKSFEELNYKEAASELDLSL